MSKKKKRKYTGNLSKPMQVRPGSSAADYQDAFEARYNELFKFYKIEPHDWHALALELAWEHVPGFSFSLKKGTGRPKRWDLAPMVRLVAAVQLIRDQEPGITIKEAIKKLPTHVGVRGYYAAKKTVKQLDNPTYWKTLFPVLAEWDALINSTAPAPTHPKSKRPRSD